MVSCERIEGGKLIPTSTNFFLLIIGDIWIGVLEETTDVGTGVRNTKHVEVHDTGDGVLHVLPGSVIVTKPVTGESTWTGEGRSGQDEVTEIGFASHLTKSLMSGLRFHVAIQVVSIVLSSVVARMSSIQGQSHVVEVVQSTGDEW